MRILHLIYDDINNPWCGGGGAIRTYEVYRRFPKNYKIIVITGAYPYCKREELKNGIKYLRIGISFNYFLSRLTYSLLAPFYIKKVPHDILIEDFSAHSPIFSFLYTKKPKIALFQNLFGRYELKNYKGLKKMRGILSYLFEVLAIKNFKNIIAVSKIIEEEIYKIKKRETFFIPYGVEEILFSSLPKEENYILFLGRWDVEQKGIDTLLLAYQNLFSELAKEETPELYLVGKGKDEKMIRKIITNLNLTEKVRLLPSVYGEEKRRMIENSLFVCMPSRFESFGIVACEAQACGKPIIATKIPSLTTLIIENKTGILVEKDNVEKLTKAMVKLIRDKELRKFLGENGKEWAKQFDWEAIANKQLDCYINIKLIPIN